MSVLIVTPDVVGPTKNGGIGTACFHYARTLANAGIRTSVLFTTEVRNGTEEQFKKDYAQRGIEFLTKSALSIDETRTYSRRSQGKLSRAIAEFLRVNDFSYILFQDWQANGFWTMRYKRMGLAFADKTLSVITHSPTAWQKQGMQTFGLNPLKEAALEWEEKETIAAADVLISPSGHMVQWMRDNNYQLPSRIEICPYTYEDKICKGRQDRADHSHLIFFGRLETRKGLHLLADSLRALQQKGKPLPRKISLLGKLSRLDTSADSCIAQLQTEVSGIDYRVETNFDHSAAIAYIARENGIVVIPSLLDNYPLTVIEAIANGFCFIASNVGGIPEMADPAVLFPPTVAGLTEKLLALNSIPFSELHHPHSFTMAREKWLAHVRSQIAPKRTAVNRCKSSTGAVSICIPFYHHDAYLPRLVDRFLQMRNPDLELVLVNDGTPETACPNFVRLKEELEPLGHVFHTQENAGAGAARNKAAELARHDRLIFFDSDNIPFPNLVNSLCSALQESGADSVAAPFLAVPPLTLEPSANDVQFAYLPSGGPLSLSLIENCLGDTCSIQRKSVFQSLGGFSTNRAYLDDWEYFIKLVGRGHRHLVYPEPLFYYTYDPDGRRSLYTQYKKMSQLWEGFAAIEKEKMAESLTVLAKQIFVSIHAAKQTDRKIVFDRFATVIIRIPVLLGLYRRLMFQDRAIVHDAVSQLARNHGLPQASISTLSQNLARPAVITTLLLHRLMFNHDKAKNKILREVKRSLQ